MAYVWFQGDFFYKSFLQLIYMHNDVYEHLLSKVREIDYNSITENDKRLCALYLLIYEYFELLQHGNRLLSTSGVHEVLFHNSLLMI